MKDLWLEFIVYVTDHRTKLTYDICGLCGNSGWTGPIGGKTPAGVIYTMQPRPCICPNGRANKI